MNTENVEKWREGQEIREEDEVTVCELFDQYERKGRAEGIKKDEKKEGKSFCKADTNSNESISTLCAVLKNCQFG